MSVVRFPISADVFARLPRHPDWRYEMVRGEAYISPRPSPLVFRRATGEQVPSDGVSGMKIREINFARDEHGLVDLVRDVWAEQDPYRSADTPEAIIEHEFERSLETVDVGAVAVQSGRVCGMVLVEGESWTSAPWLTWLSVSPAIRRQGVATALLAVVVDVLAGCGVAELASATSAANPASLCWHLSRGFQLTAGRRGAVPPPGWNRAG